MKIEMPGYTDKQKVRFILRSGLSPEEKLDCLIDMGFDLVDILTLLLEV